MLCSSLILWSRRGHKKPKFNVSDRVGLTHFAEGGMQCVYITNEFSQKCANFASVL